MTVESASVYVQDHGFFVSDHGVETPFDMMDYSTGIGGVMESAALLAAGIDRGFVTVSALPAAERPALDTVEQWAKLAIWDDVAEFSLWAPHGGLGVAQLTYGPLEPPTPLPLLSSHGPGHYRLRIHASGRDRDYDQVVDQSGEKFHIIAWPAPAEKPQILRATSRHGYGLRLAALSASSPNNPRPSPAEDQTEARHQAILSENLRRVNSADYASSQRRPLQPPS